MAVWRSKKQFQKRGPSLNFVNLLEIVAQRSAVGARRPVLDPLLVSDFDCVRRGWVALLQSAHQNTGVFLEAIQRVLPDRFLKLDICSVTCGGAHTSGSPLNR